ncbi:MAG: hypothetical protein [crAssphage sp. isolate ctcc615]|uniref:Uncharacterized protein n=1 Tax=crAssphage sp. isolate ctcc615 TaxID=2989853 RepID=A0A345BP46_9CAUD|nr:MAG: hypothetical protein KNU00_gp01 [crAssphage sp. isolate ctcc615]AXF52217.1 MAG: hypothetical protein [crAssphage sp. isolate ctcc615]
MSCNLSIDKNIILDKIREKVGTNDTLYVSYISEIMNHEGFLEEFTTKLKDKLNLDIDNIPQNKLEDVVNFVEEYYNYKHPDINFTANVQYMSTNLSKFGYGSVAARELAKRLGANQMLSVYHQILRNKNTTIDKYLKEESKKRGKTITKKEFFASQVMNFVRKEIINRLESRGVASKQSVMMLFKENNTAAIEQLFGKNMTIQDQNLLAVYKEILGNRVGFFNEVFRDSRLGEIRIENTQELEEDVQYEATENQLYDDPDEGNVDEENSPTQDRGQKVDNSTEKFGDYNNYMTHVNMSVRSYLDSLKKLHSGNAINGKPDYNLDNELGIADTMNADQCCAILYSYGNFVNVDTMIQSIRDIANTLPGFAAFHEMANYLSNNRDFAYEIYRTFGKTIISKLETVIDGTNQTSRISNYAANKISALKFEYFNAAKATSVLLDEVSDSVWRDILNDIKTIESANETINTNTSTSEVILNKINELKRNNEATELKVIADLTKQLRKYYPTLEDYTIINYCRKANNGSFTENTRKLTTILKNTVDGSVKSRKEYDSRRADIGSLFKKRRNLVEQEMNGVRISRKQFAELESELNELYNKEYVSDETRNAAFALANELVNYSTVKTELNARNVHGNQSSCVINNSMITNIINTLQSNTALENFGKYKGQSRQYDFSNIMIEHRDEDGKIINYGLFTQDPITKELTPTTYAKNLLSNRLFDGASDLTNSDNNALYADMSKGDYMTTGFINFFNVDTTYEENPYGISFANYFMRIPSDAPKNFVIKAPRYSVNGLFTKDANGNRTINTNHPVYKQFRQIFIQELTDAATAVNKFFKTKDGMVLLNQDKKSESYGMPLFNEGFDNSESTARSLYAGYHVGKGKTLLTKNDKGLYELSGTVFRSDRFTITKTNENGEVVTENYGNKILDEVFNILYGGANNSYIHIVNSEKGVTVNLTESQEAAVSKHLSQFLLDYIEQANSRMSQYKSFIPENLYNDKNIAEFTLNYHLMYVGFNDLFEGDTKFYKDTQTFLKRAKEAQASGVPYGLTNYNMDLSAPRARVISDLNNKTFEIKKEDGTTQVLNKYIYDKAIESGSTVEEATKLANTIEQTNKFRGITIKNTIRTGETIGTFKEDEDGNITFDKIGSLSKKLIEVLRESGMTLKAAKQKASNMMSGYENTTVNDAQSYITFEEWIRRVSARGQLNKYMPLIEAILDESKPLDAKTIGDFIQVQKNFYYDQHYNEKLGVIAPRQIKNAEFVLVPRLIKGTELEKVYDLMQKHGIDQLNTEETSKAGKCNVLTLWDKEGNLTSENIADFEANAARSTELYNYNYLYTQQETPQHVNAQNKAGIQIMKKIVDNIPENSPIYHLKEKFFRLYSDNIKSSFDELIKEFNLETDENGNLKLDKNNEISGLNYELFYERLQEEVARLGLDSNMMDFVTLSTDGDTMMPTYMSNVASKLESIAQSLFNSRITRQKLPGFHAAQITNVGWSSFGDKVKGVNYDKKLKYHPNGEPYVEIMLPKSNFNLKYTNPDGTLKTDDKLLKELQDSGLDTMIGYRIPTEGKQSVCVMKVVGFTDDSLGSTIVVPDDWVAQTGSDFDIDSVYGINFTGYIDEKGIARKTEYKEDNPSKDGRNNEILQTMIDILSSNEALEENLSRSNFDGIADAKKELATPKEKAIRAGRSSYNIFDQSDYQEDVMSGAKLKAFSVTRDTFCSVCNTVKPTLRGNNPIKVVYKAENGFTLKNLKKSFNDVKEIAPGTFVVTHDTFGWTKDNKNVLGSILTAYSSQTTAHILDAVKEGAVTNVNDFTFQVYKLFPDLGCDYSTAIAFMMQPGVSSIVRAYNSNKSIYSDGRINPVKTAIKEIARKLLKLDGVNITEKTSHDQIIKALQRYNLDIAKLFGASNEDFKISLNNKEIAKLLISKDRMKERLDRTGVFATNSPVESKRELLFDLGVVLQYSKLSDLGNTVSAYARVCNPDKFGAKQTIFETNKTFNDIVELANKETSVFTTEKGNFISAIYPGVELGLDSFITSPKQESAYTPLYNFLKYATAPSIKVNKHLFATQSSEFVKEINKLQDLFSGDYKMTAKIYKDFQNYVLNYLYSQTDAVKQSCTYVIGEGFVFRPGGNIEEERRRIYGYGKTPDIVVPDGNGGLTKFEVANINNPTQREINQFATLSPAQKVTWIQQKFRENGVFKYMRTSLVNGNNTNRAGMQTIQYVEGNQNIETVYNEFEKCFYNNNPLVALAALDIVKYGFAVEGFRMRRNAVNKVIKNSVLYNDAKANGTGIVSQLNDSIKNITNGTINMDELRENYIRSHSTMYQIESHRVKKDSSKQYELIPDSAGIIFTNLELAEKYGIATDIESFQNYGVNEYVKLTFGKSTTLYKIVDLQYGQIAVYPVNTLESNEFSTWSANDSNNRYLRKEYYESVLKDYKESLDRGDMNTTFEEILERKDKDLDTYRFTPRKTRITTFAKTFDINDKGTAYSGGFENVIDKVTDYFSKNPVGELYVHSSALGRFIKNTGAINGSVQKINGKYYTIQKVNFSRKNNTYIKHGRPVTENNPQIKEMFEKAQDANYEIKDAFLITPYNENVGNTRNSSVTERNDGVTATTIGVRSMKTMANRRASEGDQNAISALEYLNNKDITSSNASVSENIEDVIRTTAEYVQTSVEDILNNLNYFMTDADGVVHSITEPEIMDLIRNNQTARNKFLKTILDARAFVRNYKIINELDVDSESENIKHLLKKIKDSIHKLQNATIINNAEKAFANDVLAKYSNNPLIQDNIISVLDGYHSTGAFDAWVNDLQETSNPLLQIVTKEVMGDIRAKEMLATKRVREFKTRVAEIKKKAKEAGVSINWKHIIDDYGKFVQDYNQAFLDRLTELRNDISNAKITYGVGSIEHLKAKLEYDKWKLKNTNQMLKDEYYTRRIALEEHMLNSFSAIYSEYKQLQAKQRELLNRSKSGVLDQHYQDELKQVKQEINNLVETYYYDQSIGQFVQKKSNSDPSNPFTGKDRKIMSLEAANALQAHLKAMKALREEYFEESEKFGFQEQLDKYLDIINNYEMRDANGEITTPMAELMKHEDYVKAKEWINNNTRFVINQEIQEKLSSAFKALKSSSEGRKVLKAIAKKNEAYDSFGVIDATKFTDEEIENIRKEQLANFNIKENQPFSDRTLISNAPTDDTIFSAEFYKRMTLDGAKNQDYLAKVNEINSILSKYYTTYDNTLHTSEITEEDINELHKLYEELDNIKTKGKSTNGKQVHKFIQDHVEFTYDMVKYEREREFARQKGDRYFRLWKKINETVEETESGETKVVPNRYIYGYAKPKGYKEDGTGDNTYVDKNKTEAIRTIRKYTRNTKTQYYYQKYKEMRAKSDEEFNKWYNTNHIYNPYTHTTEPIQCWTKLEVKDDVVEEGTIAESASGTYVPSFNQTDVKPKEDKINSNYKVGRSTADNYKGGISEYNNDIQVNEAEKEMRQLFQDTLRGLANTTQANKFLDKGYMVSRAKQQEHDAAFYAKESAKLLGWINTSSGKESWYSDDRIDYSNDTTIDMPMTTLLKSKESIDVPRVAPKREENESIDDYEKRLAKFNEDKKKAEEHNAKIHKDLLDNNWESVMEEFIHKAAHFNAVQDNKYMLFYAKQMIDKLEVYSKNLGFNDLEKTGERSDDGENHYVTKQDTRLQEQYINWIRRLVYDQWKKPNNRFTRAANVLQSLTSAKFMMLNVTGGIANITVGETQVIAEALAKEHFGGKTWAMGMNTWRAGLPSFIADMYKEEATTLASAICKFMNVIDFDENTGSVHVPDAAEYIKRVRDLAFSPQAIGEHMMQNGAMFSMMHSHRLFINEDKENNGKLSYELLTESQYTNKLHQQALKEILTEEQKELFDKFVKSETSDANSTKEYAWFRKNFATEFANIYLNYEQKKKFTEKRDALIEKAKREFNDDKNHPTLFSQLKLGKDGKLDFKEDSILSSIGEEAYQILGHFKGRVISVNKKIHGVYDRLGAAKWESQWWGSLVMQYHKHLYPGIMKRYRRQGYFNEERATIEKGCYASIKDFLALPLHKAKAMKKLQQENGMTDAEVTTMQGLQNIVKAYVDFALHAKLNYDTMSEYDRANIRRAFGDFIGVMSAVCLAIALRVAAGDDDEDKGLVYNLMMYEADRLASESFMYNPLGLVSEGKKLWSSPVAFTNSIEDGLATVGLISQWAIQGDEFDPYYSSGLYAGENKFDVMIKRNIPMYHSIYMLERLNRSNKYYKLGDNMLTIIPTKQIADYINE